MVLKTAAVDPVNYRRYIFYIFLGLLSTFLTIALAAVVRCCANRAPAKVCFFPSRYSPDPESFSPCFSDPDSLIPDPIRSQLKIFI
jgi:hypothetical protein